MNYTVTLKDKRTFVVDDSKTPKEMVLRAMLNQTPVGFNGVAVSGAMIATVEDGDGDYGPHLFQEDSADMLRLAGAIFDPKNSKYFWNVIVRRNMTKAPNDPFYHNSVVDWALKNTSYTTPEDILAFLDSEWESAKVHNVPPKPRERESEVIAKTKDFLATEEGQQYKDSARARGWS